MKRIILFIILLGAISIASIAREVIGVGKTHTQVGDYKIESINNPKILKGKELKTFIVSYQNLQMDVMIVLEKNIKGMNFYVLSDSLSVKYVCNRNYFGVEMLGKELEEDGYITSQTALNRQQYFHQKVITQSVYSCTDYTKLIAAYFPLLLKSTRIIIS